LHLEAETGCDLGNHVARPVPLASSQIGQIWQRLGLLWAALLTDAMQFYFIRFEAKSNLA